MAKSAYGLKFAESLRSVKPRNEFMKPMISRWGAMLWLRKIPRPAPARLARSTAGFCLFVARWLRAADATCRVNMRQVCPDTSGNF